MAHWIGNLASLSWSVELSQANSPHQACHQQTWVQWG